MRSKAAESSSARILSYLMLEKLVTREVRPYTQPVYVELTGSVGT